MKIKYLIPTSKLIKVYNFINPQYGSSIVLPETSDGKLIIISPFLDEDGTVLNINIVDKFGVVKEINLSENWRTEFGLLGSSSI